MKKEQDLFIIEPGDSLVVIGNIGLKGTEIMASQGDKELLSYYNKEFINSARLLYENAPSEDVLVDSIGAFPCKIVENGGIFKALWDISVEYKIGFEVDIFDIPVKQETIELSNFFDINPYEMLSGKCILAVVNGGRKVINSLAEKNIKVSIIGEIMEGNDKIIRHQDGALFLRPAKTDSIDFFINRKGR